MQPAARVGDMHTCPLVEGIKPHVGGPVLPPGSTRVLIGGLPAARIGDQATCIGPPDQIATGSSTVLIEGRPAARLGDTTVHGGLIIAGCPTVLIGDSGSIAQLKELGPVNQVNESGQTEICLGYTQVFGTDGAYHAFVIARNPVTGEEYITRAGPSAGGFSESGSAVSSSASGGSVSASSGDGGSGGFGFGSIRAQNGLWSDSLAFDRPSDTVAQECFGTVDIPYNEVVSRMIEFSEVTNDNQIPYWPTGPNSNSYAFTFVESLGLPRPSPLVEWTPGHDMGVPDPDLSYYP